MPYAVTRNEYRPGATGAIAARSSVIPDVPVDNLLVPGEIRTTLDRSPLGDSSACSRVGSSTDTCQMGAAPRVSGFVNVARKADP